MLINVSHAQRLGKPFFITPFELWFGVWLFFIIIIITDVQLYPNLQPRNMRIKFEAWGFFCFQYFCLFEKKKKRQMPSVASISQTPSHCSKQTARNNVSTIETGKPCFSRT